jgi:hypothetical protein
MTVLRAAMEVVMFETERFVTDRRAAFSEDSTHKAARDVLARAVYNPTVIPKSRRPVRSRTGGTHMRRLVLPISFLVVLATGHIAASQADSRPDAASGVPGTVSNNNSVTPAHEGIDKLMSSQERASSIAAIKAAMANLPGVDTVADNQALAQFMAARPEFVDAGTSDSGFTVWGQWRDGVQYLIVSNPSSGSQRIASQKAMRDRPFKRIASAASIAGLLRRPDDVMRVQDTVTAPASTSPEDGKPSNLPKSNQYRLLSSNGPGFLDIRPALRNYLGNAGYQEVQADATVQSLKTVGGDGVFYFDAHGGTPKDSYALWTADAVTPANDELFKEDLARGGLVVMNACYDATIPGDDPNNPNASFPDPCASENKATHPERFQDHYAITAQFIMDHWGNFSDYSMVYIDGCNFDRTTSASFITALVAKHANVIFGWNGVAADDDAAATARYIFDRLTGANDFEPQILQTGFNQRPFDWVSVLADCFHRDPAHCSSTTTTTTTITIGTTTTTTTSTAVAQLTATEATPGCNMPAGVAGFCGETFGLLAPSIRRMWVYESPNLSIMPSDLLFIIGLFGNDPGGGDMSVDSAARGVSIDGTDVSVLLWTPSAIVVNLPHAGAGAAGDVVVRNGSHFSNTAQLTEWTVPLTFTLDDFQSLAEKVTINAHFRADIRKTVERIGEPPVEPSGDLPTLPSGFPLFLPSGLSWNTVIDDTGGQDTCTGNAMTTANGQTNTENWKGSNAISYNNDGHPPDAADSYLHVMDSTTIVLTLVDWRGTCTSNVSGSSVPSTVQGLRPGEASPTSEGSQDGIVPFLLDQTGTITANQVPPKNTNSHSLLGGGSTVKASLSWPETAPSRGAPDPNSAR